MLVPTRLWHQDTFSGFKEWKELPRNSSRFEVPEHLVRLELAFGSLVETRALMLAGQGSASYLNLVGPMQLWSKQRWPPDTSLRILCSCCNRVWPKTPGTLNSDVKAKTLVWYLLVASTRPLTGDAGQGPNNKLASYGSALDLRWDAELDHEGIGQASPRTHLHMEFITRKRIAASQKLLDYHCKTSGQGHEFCQPCLTSGTEGRDQTTCGGILPQVFWSCALAVVFAVDVAMKLMNVERAYQRKSALSFRI